MARKGDKVGNQKDLFDGVGAAAAAKAVKEAKAPKQAAGGGAGGLPPHFAPLAGELGDSLPLGRYASTQYLQYAIATVKDRALPRVGDGQKPVQARILYAMWDMGGRSGTPRKKSARVVGDVLGKFHPHGDASVYDALVRLSQDFTLRYPLIDGEGNFGSRDGDDPAAMRYTEARLTQFAEVLLAELDQGTVDFVPNYDGSTMEPAILPARLPVLLLNGASGIAVGMATEVPPHNLIEVAQAAIAMIREPDLSLAGVMKHVKGPDFPGGGQIITPRAEMKDAYQTGRGSVRVRARWTIERLARGQWQLVVTELPPGASARKVLEEIDAITNPLPKPGKKSLTPEQTREKQLALSLLERARDESDRSHPVRLVFEPRTAKIGEEEFANFLLAKTSLETNAPINLVMVGLDGRPTGKNLRDAIAEWLEFRFATVTRRTKHRLEQVLDRIHVLEGRMIVLLNVDKVIKIIRNADDPKADLIKAFKLSERQADDILEIRLRQLAKLEHIRIEQELEERKKERKGLEKVLGSRKALEELVIDEIEADVKSFGDKRRTRIEEAGEGDRRDTGDRRAGDGDLLEERLGAGAPGVGRGRLGAVVQGGRRARRADPVPHRRSGRVPRFQGSRVHGRGGAAAVGAWRRRAGILAGRSAGGRQDHVLRRREAGHERAGGVHRRLRLLLQARGHDLEPSRRPRVHDPRGERDPGRAGDLRRGAGQSGRRGLCRRPHARVRSERAAGARARPRDDRDGARGRRAAARGRSDREARDRADRRRAAQREGEGDRHRRREVRASRRPSRPHGPRAAGEAEAPVHAARTAKADAAG